MSVERDNSYKHCSYPLKGFKGKGQTLKSVREFEKQQMEVRAEINALMAEYNRTFSGSKYAYLGIASNSNPILYWRLSRSVNKKSPCFNLFCKTGNHGGYGTEFLRTCGIETKSIIFDFELKRLELNTRLSIIKSSLTALRRYIEMKSKMNTYLECETELQDIV